MRMQTLRFKDEDTFQFQNRRDNRYYNTGSCVHPMTITGIEITFGECPHLEMLEWGLATESGKITVRKIAVIS